jgi:hypothetical protein
MTITAPTVLDNRYYTKGIADARFKLYSARGTIELDTPGQTTYKINMAKKPRHCMVAITGGQFEPRITASWYWFAGELHFVLSGEPGYSPARKLNWMVK